MWLVLRDKFSFELLEDAMELEGLGEDSEEQIEADWLLDVGDSFAWVPRNVCSFSWSRRSCSISFLSRRFSSFWESSWCAVAKASSRMSVSLASFSRSSDCRSRLPIWSCLMSELLIRNGLVSESQL